MQTTLSSTVTIWCVSHVDCAARIPHKGVERHCAFRSRAQPTIASALSAHTFRWAPLAMLQVMRCQLRSPMPPRSSHLLSSESAATSQVLPRRAHSPDPPYFWTQLRRLLHTVLLLLMQPNPRSRSSFSGASTPKTLWIARSHHRHKEMPAAPRISNPLASPLFTLPAAPAAPAVVTFAPRLRARGSTLRHCRHQVSRIKLP